MERNDPPEQPAEEVREAQARPATIYQCPWCSAQHANLDIRFAMFLSQGARVKIACPVATCAKPIIVSAPQPKPIMPAAHVPNRHERRAQHAVQRQLNAKPGA